MGALEGPAPVRYGDRSRALRPVGAPGATGVLDEPGELTELSELKEPGAPVERGEPGEPGVLRQTMPSAISASSRAVPYAVGVPYERRATYHQTLASTSTTASAITA